MDTTAGTASASGSIRVGNGHVLQKIVGANDATVEAGVTYTVPGTKGTTISASYSNDDDDFDAGTQVKMAFSF